MEYNSIHRRRWAAEVLSSEMTPLNKVRKLVALGYDEDDADNMVSSLMGRPAQNVYYEQLPTPDYEER